jgi:hypothetical protein
LNVKSGISLLAIIAATQVSGCASIVNGQNQSVSVEAMSEGGAVIGATCKLANNKGEWFVTSPGSTMVHRSYQNLDVSCAKEPLDPGTASVASSTKGMAFGNILFGGVIGAGVDMATGAAYDYPTLITVLMGKQAAVPAVAASAAAPAMPASASTEAAASVKPVTLGASSAAS